MTPPEHRHLGHRFLLTCGIRPSLLGLFVLVYLYRIIWTWILCATRLDELYPVNLGPAALGMSLTGWMALILVLWIVLLAVDLLGRCWTPGRPRWVDVVALAAGLGLASATLWAVMGWRATAAMFR
jgi:hypothetical protein